MTIYIFDDFCIERVTGRGHNISDLCCKVFVGIHTFYESRTVVESRYIDGQQINSLSGYSEAGIRNIYVNTTVQVYILLPYWSLPGVVCCSSGSVCAMLTLFSDQIGVNQLASHDDWLIIYNDPRLRVTEAPLLLLSHYVLAPTTGKYFVFGPVLENESIPPGPGHVDWVEIQNNPLPETWDMWQWVWHLC